MFKQIARFGKKKKKEIWRPKEPDDVLKEVPGIQKRRAVEDIVLAVLKNRRDTKKYFEEDVSDFFIMRILEAARHSYSEGNSQPWEFIIVRDPVLKQHIAEACFNHKIVEEAPVLIVVCSNVKVSSALYGDRGIKLYSLLALGAAIQNILNAAEAIGLGTNVIGNFPETQIAILTHCPEYVRPAAIITLGWPAEKAKAPVLHKLEEIIHVESLGETHYLKRITKERARR